MRFFLLSALAVMLLFSSCKEDKPMTISKDFTLTIENVIEGKDYFDNGTTGLITPGMSESFTFNAGKGHYFQFATMFVQSNDLFLAPSMTGIALYDDAGNALTGDITDKILLWDAGTEVNEEPGVGTNQAPRQSEPNTGTDENGTVELISDVDDGFTYPDVQDVIQVTVTHDGGTMFTVTLTNVSNNSSLPTPFAPGTWVVHSMGQTPMFTKGSPASPGLEAIAEDGNNSKMNDNLTSKSGLVSPFAPGAYSVGSNNGIFKIGAAASADLEALAEDGNPGGFANVFNTPDGASAPGPIFPGGSYSFSFTAEEGDKLSLATMFVQSNDWFVGLDQVDLFSNGTAKSGDLTSMAKLYDAGTETDEYAGAGNNQPPRQSGSNTGTDEGENVAVEDAASANTPSVSQMVKITLTVN